jgi:hypothetical protein
MNGDQFTRDLSAMLERRGSDASSSVQVDVFAIATMKRRPRLLSTWRSAMQLGGRLAMTGIAVAILGGALVVGMVARGSAGAAAAQSHSGVLFCGQAIAAARVGHSGSTVTFTDPAAGVLEDLVFPSGFSTRVTNGAAQLLYRDGSVIGSEGQVLTLGGGIGIGAAFRAGAFGVCTVNGVNYPLP